ncbi:uncharacterized protein EI90DRAFT_3076248 [Cantharellus anzutake]|uniref:uncharacterized protein n=1 Tax=Cantharellus anzutake TaxID=1750568 RepID=UPI0019042F9A|nr:uncharacterized protein EI90DRAFT_3076248 [Cantharellus anzutake]KAF8324197.1 hypothetical protein EI90DRAFT_3076248 [Cantharellus anzutake]
MYAEAFAVLGDYKGTVTKETQVELFLQYAVHIASTGDADQALAGYNNALALMEIIEAERPSSGPSKANFRLSSLLTAALASQAFSSIQISRDNVTAGIDGLLQSLCLSSAKNCYAPECSGVSRALGESGGDWPVQEQPISSGVG